MKKILLSIFLVISLLFVLSGCASKAGKEFKSEYEALNGKTNSSGMKHRTIKIDKDNPFEKVSASEIISKIENKETFYVYFGDELCPWCRSVLEKAIEVANQNKIKKIYYVKVWDSSGKEILRNKYILTDDNGVEETISGTDEYNKLLEYFDPVLEDYTLTDSNGDEITLPEKRIFAPNFIYVEKGEAKRLVSGISENQEDSRSELTKEVLKDEEETFKEFFK